MLSGEVFLSWGGKTSLSCGGAGVLEGDVEAEVPLDTARPRDGPGVSLCDVKLGALSSWARSMNACSSVGTSSVFCRCRERGASAGAVGETGLFSSDDCRGKVYECRACGDRGGDDILDEGRGPCAGDVVTRSSAAPEPMLALKLFVLDRCRRMLGAPCL